MVTIGTIPPTGLEAAILETGVRNCKDTGRYDRVFRSGASLRVRSGGPAEREFRMGSPCGVCYCARKEGSLSNR